MRAHLNEIVVEVVERGVCRMHRERYAPLDHLAVDPDQNRSVLPEEDLVGQFAVRSLVEEENALIFHRQVFSNRIDLVTE